MKRFFEKIASAAVAILGSSITFIVALCITIYWLSNISYTEGIHSTIGDIVLGITFLSLFVIQKSFNRFSALLHLRISELVSSHALANHDVIKLEEKAGREIKKLSEEYSDDKLPKKPKKNTTNPIVFFTD